MSRTAEFINIYKSEPFPKPGWFREWLNSCGFFELRLFQNFSFWNSFLRFSRKTGLLAGFSKSLSIEPEVRTNRVLEQAQFTQTLSPFQTSYI
jgi:hypothetical protein